MVMRTWSGKAGLSPTAMTILSAVNNVWRGREGEREEGREGGRREREGEREEGREGGREEREGREEGERERGGGRKRGRGQEISFKSNDSSTLSLL